MFAALSAWIEQNLWQHRSFFSYFLLPLSVLFFCASSIRKYFLQKNAYQSKLPVIVIGNISVGGNGKTPVLIAIAKFLTEQGMRVAVISRGYKAQTTDFPKWVDANSSAQVCGDEPVMIAKQTGLKVLIDPNRTRAIKAIEVQSKFDVILSDDGLQHYKMSRSIEIAVLGSQQALGNHFLLPAGPLREPISRLKTVDWVLGDKSLPYVNVGTELKVKAIVELHTGNEVAVEFFKDKDVAAVTGIAWPERFYQTLEDLGILFSKNSFPDHHNFIEADFFPLTGTLILMTEKDAVKCCHMALENAYVLKIEQKLPQAFLDKLLMDFSE